MMRTIAHHGWGIVGQANFCSQCDLHILPSIYLRVWLRIYISNEIILILTFLQKFQPFLFCATGKSGLSAGQVMSQPPWSRHQVFDHQTQPWCPSFQLRSELSCHAMLEPWLQTVCIKWTKWKHDVGKGKYKKFKSKLTRFFCDCLLTLPEGTLRALWRCRCWIKSG